MVRFMGDWAVWVNNHPLRGSIDMRTAKKNISQRNMMFADV